MCSGRNIPSPVFSIPHKREGSCSTMLSHMPGLTILAGNYMLKMDPIRPLITLGWGNSRGFMGCQAPAGDAHHYSPN